MAYKKHPGGKPPKYKTAAQMQEKIDAYFTACEGEPLTGPDGVQMFDKHGNELRVGAIRLPLQGWLWRWVLLPGNPCWTIRPSGSFLTR